MNQSNYQTNFYLSPNISRKNTHEMSTRYSAINPVQQSQFMEEDQMQNIISSTSNYNINPAQSLNPCSTNELISQIQRANKSVCQMTNDLRNFNDSIRQRTGLEDTRKSTQSFYQNSVSPISNCNMNATNFDYSFPSPVQKTSRSYTSHANYANEIPISVSQNLNAPLRSSQYVENLRKSSNNLKQSVAPETNLRVSSYHDGNKTVINFPFMSYSQVNQDKEIADTRVNYKSTIEIPRQKKQEEDNMTRRYYVKHEDLEYEEFEDFENPSNNYKKIRYPYTSNWQTIYQAPEFIQSLIEQQKNRSEVHETQQSQQLIPNQQTVQQQEAVKYSNYLPKQSFNFLDDTQYRSCVDTNNTLSGSYISTSANNIPFSYY